VLVELAFGSHPGNRYGAKDIAKLVVQLADAARVRNAGFCAGTVTIPESTTLIFYGDNADTLYRSIELILANDHLCKGATVSIRQGKKVREVLVPERTK
jgi:hypothetical protein